MTCRFDACIPHGDVGEWLNQQVANLPKPQGCARSNRAVSAIMEGTAVWTANGPESRGAPMHSGWGFESSAFSHF